MTVAPSGLAGRRPSRPRPSWKPWAGVGLALVITVWAARGIGLSIRELIEKAANAGRILDEAFPPAWGAFEQTIGPFLETFRIAVIASTLGCSIALVVAFLASKITSPDRVTWAISRSTQSVIRSIPDILYALVFVAAVSIGPLAGILALFLFDIGVVAKLLSESIDAVDEGPVEAADASGATVFQRIRTAVFPQVLPNYVAYSLYTFELNLRAAAVIGLVGAGGIGQTLNVARTIPRYDVVALIVVEIFVVVFVVESISIALRRRLV